MVLGTLDVTIILVYFALTLAVGIAVTRRASKSLDSYFLAGNNVPWYVLGFSNASAMWDITGTMWLVYNVVVYGLKGAYLPWLWPTFNQVVFMVYLAGWVRRSNVLTGAAWISTRFGEGRGGELCRLMVAVFALISVVGFIAYDFAGMGKFAKTFLPWDLSANTYAAIVMAITTVYVVLGGMLSVILTDLAQFVIMVGCSIAIAVIAMNRVSMAEVSALLPSGWFDLSIDWKLGLDWTKTLPPLTQNVAEDGYSFFGLFFMAMLFKGILVSMAGPAPNYDMQRILAAKNPREAQLMSSIVSVGLISRWLMVAGVALIGITLIGHQLGDPNSMRDWTVNGRLDLEMLLPIVIKDFVPVGLVGLLMAGLLAAFMSTFSATLNAGAAYLVNDVYKRYLNTKGSTRHYLVASYIGTVVILAVGIVFGLTTGSINEVTQWIVNGLWGGYAAPNLLKWHWWRFNGYGYFWGMLLGMAAALSQKFVAPQLRTIEYFPIILAVSTLGSVLGSLLSSPDDRAVLDRFYKSVRPWGFWGPVRARVMAADPSFAPNRNLPFDALNTVVGIVWQLQLVVIPVYLVFRAYRAMWICIAIFLVTSAILKKTWLNRLEASAA